MKVIAERERRFGRAGDDCVPFHPGLIFVEDRLEFGIGAMLARIMMTRGGRLVLVYEGGEERALARLAAAYQRPFSQNAFNALERAAGDWLSDKGALAYIRLAQAGLSKFASAAIASRSLSLADELIEKGLDPAELVQAIAWACESQRGLSKGGCADELRVPKGNGEQSGEWTEFWQNYLPVRFGGIDYKPIHDMPPGAIEVVSSDGAKVRDPSSPTQTLLGPAHPTLQDIYQDGVSNSDCSDRATAAALFERFAHAGTYDFQRNSDKHLFYWPYRSISNYAIGVFANGAGVSLDDTLRAAKTYALLLSSNHYDPTGPSWIESGWQDAARGKWKRRQ